MKSLSRHGPALGVLLVSLVITAIGWRAAYRHVRASDRSRFLVQLEQTKSEIVKRVRYCEETLWGTRALFCASQLVSRSEFTAFQDGLLDENRRQGLSGIGFVAYVPHADRQAFLDETRRDGASDFAITPEGDRGSYYPLKYYETTESHSPSLGFDLSIDPKWRDALAAACDSEQIELTPKVSLSQHNGAETDTVFLTVAVYRNGAPQETIQQRRRALEGWIIGRLSVSEVLHNVLREHEGQFDVELFDSERKTRLSLLYDGDHELHALELDQTASFHDTRRLAIAGQTLGMHFSTMPAFDLANDHLLPPLILLSGLTVSLLLFVVVRSLSMKREAAQALAEKMTASLRKSEARLREARDKLEVRVQERTEELQRSNTTLETEIVRRKDVEDRLHDRLIELDRTNGTLDRVNTDLRDFAYIVSHDLKAPLRGIGTLAHWIVEDNADALDDEGRENLDVLIGRVKRMDALIDGILRYSRIGRLEPTLEDLDCDAAVREIIDALAPPENIQVRVDGTLPPIHYDQAHMHQIFQNLIGNAIEHLERPAGQIVVSCQDAGEFREFCVRDNGEGIDEKHFGRIFKIFQSLRSRDKREASGIGLSLVKAIVEKHGGHIRVESTMGEGAAFFFTIPKRRASDLPDSTKTQELTGATDGKPPVLPSAPFPETLSPSMEVANLEN